MNMNLRSLVRTAGTLTTLQIVAACQSISPTPELALKQTVDPGGCVLEQVAAEPGTNQYQYDGFSPDGRSIAIGWDRKEDQRGTYLLNLQSWERTDLPTFNNGATFSPDARYLINHIYISEAKTELAMVEIESGEVTIIAPHAEWDWLPSYSPDGNTIVFNSYRSGNSDVYLYELESARLHQLTNSQNYEAHAQFSPDGQSIIYHEQASKTDYNLMLLDISSGQTTALSVLESEESYPSWSPDGKFIAFASDRDQTPGTNDIFVTTVAGDMLIKITDAPHNDGHPFWSPDGKFLYFNSKRDPQGVYRTRMKELVYCQRQEE